MMINEAMKSKYDVIGVLKEDGSVKVEHDKVGGIPYVFGSKEFFYESMEEKKINGVVMESINEG